MLKKLIITGANGQLGRAINALYQNREDIVCVNTDVEELDITNLEEVKAFVENERPYAIVNCAAYTAVDACEDQEELAFKCNRSQKFSNCSRSKRCEDDAYFNRLCFCGK